MAGLRNPAVIQAISALRRADGTITPADVVDAARPESSPLHSYFEWDDTAAAEAYRIEQAKGLLRVTVTMLPSAESGKPIRVRAFVSLSNEEGYRPIVDVMSNADRRRQLLEDVLAEMRSFQQKYRHISEVAGVINAMARAERRLTPVVAGQKKPKPKPAKKSAARRKTARG